jgi:hypothetical protein
MVSCFKTEDRQWDARFNIPTDEYLATLLANIDRMCNQEGKFKYCLVSGVEIGTRPAHNDYQMKHVHCAFILHNRMSKLALLKHLEIVQGYGFYLETRNRQLPYLGWREHHVKEFSKVDPSKPVLFEFGELPGDMGRLFITWDYVSDTPLCTPVSSPETYQEVIRDHYYKM